MNLFFTRHFHKLTRLRDESRAPCSLKIVEKYRKKKRTNGTRVDNAWYTWTPPETAPSRAIPRGETEAYEPVHSTQVAATGQLHHDLIGYRLYERFRTLSNLDTRDEESFYTQAIENVWSKKLTDLVRMRQHRNAVIEELPSNDLSEKSAYDLIEPDGAVNWNIDLADAFCARDLSMCAALMFKRI